jgi:hypothetical protein
MSDDAYSLNSLINKSASMWVVKPNTIIYEYLKLEVSVVLQREGNFFPPYLDYRQNTNISLLCSAYQAAL